MKSEKRRPSWWGAWRMWVVGIVAAIVALIVILMLMYYLTQTTITLDVDGDARKLRTHTGTVRDLLVEAGIEVTSEDAVTPSLDAPLSENMTITVRRAFTVLLRADGEVRSVRTLAVHPLDVLDGQGVSVGEFDVIQVDGDAFTRAELQALPWDKPAASIHIRRSMTLKVLDGDQTHTLHTTELDVGGALDAAGLELYLADRVTPDLSTVAHDGMTIVIERSVPITIAADGQRLSTRALGPTVGDALAFVGVAPVGQDYTIPPEDALLKPEMTIRIVRVTEKVFTEEQPLPFNTIYQPDPALALDEQRVIEPGTAGRQAQQIRVRYEDGHEVSRTVQDQWVMEPPIPRLVVYGKMDSSD